jgi:hypothetical protein
MMRLFLSNMRLMKWKKRARDKTGYCWKCDTMDSSANENPIKFHSLTVRSTASRSLGEWRDFYTRSSCLFECLKSHLLELSALELGNISHNGSLFGLTMRHFWFQFILIYSAGRMRARGRISIIIIVIFMTCWTTRVEARSDSVCVTVSSNHFTASVS